jgi:hypothetical protein
MAFDLLSWSYLNSLSFMTDPKVEQVLLIALAVVGPVITFFLPFYSTPC